MPRCTFSLTISATEPGMYLLRLENYLFPRPRWIIYRWRRARKVFIYSSDLSETTVGAFSQPSQRAPRFVRNWIIIAMAKSRLKNTTNENVDDDTKKKAFCICKYLIASTRQRKKPKCLEFDFRIRTLRFNEIFCSSQQSHSTAKQQPLAQWKEIAQSKSMTHF